MTDEPLIVDITSDVSPVRAGGAPRMIEPHPYPPYTQCCHPAVGAVGEFAQNWRENAARTGERWGRKVRAADGIFDHENCSRAARVRLLGVPMCRLHAGRVLLEMVEGLGL